MENELERSNEQALKEFLLDIRCLDRLSEWSSRFNLFDILKISGAEIRHSNVLAWLLDPNGNHGLGSAVLQGLLQELAVDAAGVDVFQVLLMDLYDFTVLREWRNIDILVISHTEKFLLCIENKLFSGEHDRQLKTYRKILGQEYPNYSMICVFLTPDGIQPEVEADREQWQAIGYTQIVNIVDNAQKGKTLSADVSMLVEHYMDAVRRHIVGDKDLERICREIYAKHRQALDLIYENRDDITSQISEEVQSWCARSAETGALSFDAEHSSKTAVRFTTPYMDTVFPASDAQNSGWKSNSIYYYEVAIRNNNFKVALSICSRNLNEGQRDVCERAIVICDKRKAKEDWIWKRLMTCNTRCTVEESSFSDQERRKIHDALESSWREIQKFEQTFRTKWEKDSPL